MTIGAKIKSRREEMQMTQEQLAAHVGYKHKSSIQKIEVGERDIPRKSLALFAKALQVPVEWFLVDDAIMDKEDAEFLRNLPRLLPLDDLPPEIEAINIIMHQFGYNIMKVNGQYFMSECGEITNDELNELLNTISISVKNATDTMIAKKTREFRDFLSNRL